MSNQRLNKFLSANSELSRRSADTAIESGHVRINGVTAKVGDSYHEGDEVSYNGKIVTESSEKPMIVLLNKPIGFVCSRVGQGSRSVYSLLPPHLQHLNIAGRLDKDSSGLVIFTNDGDTLHKLTHPSNNKLKIYHVSTDRNLADAHISAIKKGVDIGDERPSKFDIKLLSPNFKSKTIEIGKTRNTYEVAMEEGRNRQIRRTFEALGYEVVALQRVSVGIYKLEDFSLKSIQLSSKGTVKYQTNF